MLNFFLKIWCSEVRCYKLWLMERLWIYGATGGQTLNMVPLTLTCYSGVFL